LSDWKSASSRRRAGERVDLRASGGEAENGERTGMADPRLGPEPGVGSTHPTLAGVDYRTMDAAMNPR
jgi:hypothetical protein